MQNAANVAAASPLVSGGILAAPKGTALPTDEATALNAAFKAFGYASESGLEPSGDGASRKDIKAWGGDVVASVLESKSIRKFKFTLTEVFNADVAKTVFGAANVTVTAATTTAGTKLAIQDKGDEPAEQAYVFDMFYGGKKMRVVVPNGQLVVTAESPMVDTDLMGYECEITCLPDGAGVRTYRYFANDDLV